MASVDRCKDTPTDYDCVVPIAPEVVTENGDFQSQSPLTFTLSVVRKQLKRACIDCDSDVDNGSPQTPKDGVFDSFAPGPDNIPWPPNNNKYLDDYRITVSRRLHFHPSFKAVTLSDEEIVESVYRNLLQVIVSMQAEEMSNDCGKTPPSMLLHFTGIVDTCPGAPMKPVAKPRNIDLGLCKKLEF